MPWVRRVVFDTSTLVGAALKPGSVPHQALLQALAWSDVCVSAATWQELDSVLQRKHFDRYLPREARLAFVTLLRQHTHLFAVTLADEVALVPLCRDPKDNKFLALAHVCQADALVSSDADLLVLHPWCGVPVVTAAGFLALLPQRER